MGSKKFDSELEYYEKIVKRAVCEFPNQARYLFKYKALELYNLYLKSIMI
jgi:hypothetical protein